MHRGKDLIKPPAPPVRPPPPPELAQPSRWAQVSIDDIVEQVRRLHNDHDRQSRYFGKSWATQGSTGSRMILDHLTSLPGESWQDRWSLFDAQTVQRPWRDVGWPDRNTGEDIRLAAGLENLIILDVIRPSYAWQHRRGINVYERLGGCGARPRTG